MKRRVFLGGAGASLLSSIMGFDANAIGPASDVVLGRLMYPGSTSTRGNALKLLSDEVRMQTSINCSLNTPEVSLKESLYAYPLLFAICDRPRGNMKSREAVRLQEWLSSGGTLVVDNVGNNAPSEGFDDQFRRDMRAMFPRSPLKKIPVGHVLYRAFYRLDYPAGRRISRSYLEGIELDGRLAVIYSQNDFSGAWARDGFGSWEYDVTPGGERQRESAIRLGINFVEYALCQDYKADQVHVNYLLKKRKWKSSRTGKAPKAR